MMKRSWRIGLLVVILLTIGSTVSASDDYVMKRSKSEFYYQGNQLTSQNWPVVQHQGMTYIPIRVLEFASVGLVGYDAKTKRINLDPWIPSTPQEISSIYDKKEDDVFEIRINSGSKIYKAGEPLNIWATLRVNSEKNVKVRYESVFVRYYLMNSDGYRFSMPSSMMMNEAVLKPDDELLHKWSDYPVYAYNMWLNKLEESENPMEAAANTPRILRLPAGTYTIGAYTEYQIANDDHTYPSPEDMEKLEATIEITIE